jgi:uncharacterized protein (TIGR02453 family)
MDFENAFTFLKKLSRNNNREWFEKNKPGYIEIKEQFELFVETLLHEMIKFDESLAGLNPKKLTFRIYRDVRFSKDKTPYKTHVSAGFSSEGKGIAVPGYYLQIEPGNSFLAAGLWMPIPENLTRIRQEIDYNGDLLAKITNEKKYKKNFNGFWDGDKLKTMPKGYPKDHPHIDWLKLKSFIVEHHFEDSEVTDKKFLKNLLDVAKSAKPMNDFLKQALD